MQSNKENILTLLHQYDLIEKNQDLVNKIINKFDDEQLYKLIHYLAKAGLLYQKSFDLCLSLVLPKPTREILRKLIELLDGASYNLISKERLESLFSLPDRNVYRLYKITSNLIKNKLLDHHSFEEAFRRVTEKLPSPLESTVIKHSRKKTNLPRSEVILDNNKYFFMDHSKHYEQSGYGKIKKGFSSPDSDQAHYGIKKLITSNHTEAQEEAAREVKYNRLLGREAFFFSRQGKTTVVAEWQREKALRLYSPSELGQASLENRLKCLRTSLAELNVLHRHYRIHGDIKCENLILDLKNESMKLIDFGGSHKKSSSKKFATTCCYDDPYSFGDPFCKDLYAMGIVTMYLFPELYKVSFNPLSMTSSMNKSTFTPVEQAIVNLVKSMMHSNADERCTSEQALNYCDQLLAQFNNLDDLTLKAIAYASINDTTVALEDVLRM